MLPSNHNKPWTQAQQSEIKRLWEHLGYSLSAVASTMGRTKGSIWAQLCALYGYPPDAPLADNIETARDNGYHQDPQPEEDTPKGSSMERNIAAMMHDDARTVGVKFQQRIENTNQVKEYTYVTIQPLAVGDLVAVYAGGAIQVAEVCRVDAVLDIEPNDNKEYEWVVQKLDTRPYEAQVAKNEQLKTLIKENYKLNARAQMKDLILNQLSADKAKEALALLKTGD